MACTVKIFTFTFTFTSHNLIARDNFTFTFGAPYFFFKRTPISHPPSRPVTRQA